MNCIIAFLHDIVWGVPSIILILCLGFYLTAKNEFVQFRLLPKACHILIKHHPKRTVTPFRALCTALSATVGTGNLVGVSGAICLGGPGAVFWMHVCGLFGMAVKYAETVLAVNDRRQVGEGYIGGPMYYMEAGLSKRYRWLASVYALFGLIASFGIGTATQVKAITAGIGNLCKMPDNLVGVIIAVFVGLVLIGGVSAIGKTAEVLIPIAAGGYVILCLIIVFTHMRTLPNAVMSILRGAFCPRAVTGGCIGAAVQTLEYGCSRGVFSNEAGLGTAAIAHASADVDHPVEQGAMGILEVFIDTFVICTLTALAILCCGISIPYGSDYGAQILTQAFSASFPHFGTIVISAFLICFAYATILGWSVYGTRFTGYLLGEKYCKYYFVIQTLSIPLFSVMNTLMAWKFSSIVNGLMLFPNLAAIVLLSPKIHQLTREYFQRQRKENALRSSDTFGEHVDYA